jgi:hypothetical protein
MKKLYFLLTHFDADRSTRLNIRLLRECSASFFQELLEPHIVLLSTGSSLGPGMGEDVFVRLPNAGHHEGDMEMLNAGVAVALSRGADLIFKLSSNRIFLNKSKLIGLIRRLNNSNKGILSDHWCNIEQLATDVLLMKASFAKEVFPLPIAHGAVFSEHLLAEQTRKRGLWQQVLLYDERQPIHLEDGHRRTRFYEAVELLTNAEHDLGEFIAEHYPRYLPLLNDGEDASPGARPAGSVFERTRPMAHGGLSLVQEGDRLELCTADGQRTAALNETAAAIWSMCDGERTVEKIQTDLAEALQVPPKAIADDVQQTLEHFLRRKLVWIAAV